MTEHEEHRVKKGFYVHYKGGVYFVLGVAENKDEGGDSLVIYESTQGCGDEVQSTRNPTVDIAIDEGPTGLRYRKIDEFLQLVESVNGEPDPSGIPRFQRVVGWKQGIPLVTDPDGRDATVYVFTPSARGDFARFER